MEALKIIGMYESPKGHKALLVAFSGRRSPGSGVEEIPISDSVFEQWYGARILDLRDESPLQQAAGSVGIKAGEFFKLNLKVAPIGSISVLGVYKQLDEVRRMVVKIEVPNALNTIEHFDISQQTLDKWVASMCLEPAQGSMNGYSLPNLELAPEAMWQTVYEG